jgi:hypothetical protein
MATPILRDDAQKRVDEIGSADILVGIPSYNNASTIAHVVRMAARGMVEHLADLKPALVVSDGGSPDGTREVVLATEVPSAVTKIVTQYRGIPGKGSAFRTLFEIAHQLGARAVCVVDSDLRSIRPWWIDRLAGPIVREGYGYVAPYYNRHKYDGTITNNICYPTTRMLYGVDVRQPIGGDFGFSGELLSAYLSQDVWETDVARFGIDIWMTTTAINEGFRVAQANLGAKIHDAKDPAASLGPMFRQVVGTLFSLMDRYADRWKAARGSVKAPILGPVVEQEPEPVAVTLPALIEKLRAGLVEHGAVWAEILRPENMAAIRDIVAMPEAEYEFLPQRWAQILFDFAVAFSGQRETGLEPQAIIDSMTPLYFGRTAGMVRRSVDMDTATFERQVVQRQAEIFEDLKADLIRLWG